MGFKTKYYYKCQKMKKDIGITKFSVYVVCNSGTDLYSEYGGERLLSHSLYSSIKDKIADTVSGSKKQEIEIHIEPPGKIIRFDVNRFKIKHKKLIRGLGKRPQTTLAIHTIISNMESIIAAINREFKSDRCGVLISQNYYEWENETLSHNTIENALQILLKAELIQVKKKQKSEIRPISYGPTQKLIDLYSNYKSSLRGGHLEILGSEESYREVVPMTKDILPRNKGNYRSITKTEIEYPDKETGKPKKEIKRIADSEENMPSSMKEDVKLLWKFNRQNTQHIWEIDSLPQKKIKLGHWTYTCKDFDYDDLGEFDPKTGRVKIRECELIYNRHFHDNYTLHGRYYCPLTSSIKSLARMHLRVNGKPVVEVDYKSNHPQIAYNQKGLEFPGDAYDIEGYDKKIVKPVLLSAINKDNENFYQAVLGFHNSEKGLSKSGAYGKAFSKNQDEIKYRLYHGYEPPKPIPHPSEFSNEDLKKIWTQLEKKHEPIRDQLLVDKKQGLRFMFIESQIATFIMRRFVELKAPLLIYHDGFITSIDHQEDLENAMREGYKAVLGTDIEPKFEPEPTLEEYHKTHKKAEVG